MRIRFYLFPQLDTPRAIFTLQPDEKQTRMREMRQAGGRAKLPLIVYQ
jgi:hypothetical protein